MKQVIVVRKDLNMRKGKIGAQVAHASMKVLLDRQITLVNKSELVLELTQELYQWLYEEPFTKICVSVNSEEELLQIQQKAIEMGVLNALITDSGKTEFNGVPTNTCLAIGPADNDTINQITGHLPLL
jgi:PTH2 family peptidyl-tRNA hydrolase